MHGTFVAGILCEEKLCRAGDLPRLHFACAPDFFRNTRGERVDPERHPGGTRSGIIECIDAGARLVNLSAALAQVPSSKGERALGQALDYAATRGAIVVAAAGNQGTVGSTADYAASVRLSPSSLATGAADRLTDPTIGNSIGRGD